MTNNIDMLSRCKLSKIHNFYVLKCASYFFIVYHHHIISFMKKKKHVVHIVFSNMLDVCVSWVFRVEGGGGHLAESVPGVSTTLQPGSVY